MFGERSLCSRMERRVDGFLAELAVECLTRYLDPVKGPRDHEDDIFGSSCISSFTPKFILGIQQR